MIAAQLYTLRDFLKTPADITTTLRRVRHIGYTAVQVSGLGPIPPADLRRLLDDNGLVCCVTHASYDRMKSEPTALVDEHHTLGCSLTAIGGFHPKTQTAAAWSEFAAEFTTVADRLAGLGLRLGYHNHSHEFVRYGDKTAMDLMFAGFGPSVWFEIDTYWVQHGGADPAAWIDKCAGRIPVVHIKDMAIQPAADGRPGPVMAEIGEGNLNWPGIFAACKRAGVQYYAVEQDVCQRDPFESLTISLRNLASMGMS